MRPAIGNQLTIYRRPAGYAAAAGQYAAQQVYRFDEVPLSHRFSGQPKVRRGHKTLRYSHPRKQVKFLCVMRGSPCC